MKTFVHIAFILVTGVALGLVVRSMRGAPESTTDSGPGPDDVVFTDDGSNDLDPSEVSSGDPTLPPGGPRLLDKFELTERTGEVVSTDDLLGQPYIVSFFFTTCPSICIQQNQKLKELQETFEGEGVRFVAISCDPENDTPEKLREYAARFGADKDQWLFMTGDLTYIRRVGSDMYRLPVNKQFHTEKFVLVDAEGEIVGYYQWPEKRQYEQLQDKIRELINKDA